MSDELAAMAASLGEVDPRASRRLEDLARAITTEEGRQRWADVDLRRAFDTVWVLERSGYDGCVGLDVKAMRATKPEHQTQHLANSKEMFERLVAVARNVDAAQVEAFRAERNYEALEMYILRNLMGK